MVNKIVFIIICIFVVHTGFAQSKTEKQRKKEERNERIKQLIKQEEEGAIIFHKHSIFGIKLNTDGYGVFYEIGRQKTTRITNTYIIELGERKHPKEERLQSTSGTFLSNPYIFGKINNFYYTKIGFAQQRLIGGKGNKNGVAVSALYGGGVSAALMKPYYLKVIDPQTGDISDVKYKGDDNVYLYNPGFILGATGFTKGFGEIKVTPGAYAKTALRFDYGRFNEVVSALEVGIGVEYYAKKLPHMLLNKDRQFFFNAYAAIAFGRRK